MTLKGQNHRGNTLHCAPSYICDLYGPVSFLAARLLLRSAARGELLVPQTRLDIIQLAF